MMNLLNILYTNDMPGTVMFFETLGLQRKEPGEIDQWWNEFLIGDATLALHWNDGDPIPAQSNPELHFGVPGSELESLHARLRQASYDVDELGTLENVGRFFVCREPGGARIQVNES